MVWPAELLTGAVQKRKAALLELVPRPRPRGQVGDLELNRRLGDGTVVGPSRLTEACLSRFCECPDAEVLYAGDLELPRLRRVGG
ncbi:MAG TPA: hypothetical protein VJ625_10095 [Propionibacteriaceae bacterium]|nr:hypothetical protein [Propionibacteriaceae bacterium]